MDRDQIFVASKPFKLGKAEYAKGDAVDVSALPDYKLSQLLNQRYFSPMSADAFAAMVAAREATGATP